MTDAPLGPGAVVWAELEPVRGREQGGRRPVVVVSATTYLAAVATLAVVVPITTTDRGWPNHVLVDGPAGLGHASWIMTEQPRTITRDRIVGHAGRVSGPCLREVRTWLAAFLDL